VAITDLLELGRCFAASFSVADVLCIISMWIRKYIFDLVMLQVVSVPSPDMYLVKNRERGRIPEDVEMERDNLESLPPSIGDL